MWLDQGYSLSTVDIPDWKHSSEVREEPFAGIRLDFENIGKLTFSKNFDSGEREMSV